MLPPLHEEGTHPSRSVGRADCAPSTGGRALTDSDASGPGFEPDAPGTDAPGTDAPAGGADTQNPCTVTPRANGPLVVEGRLTIVNPDGTVTEATKVFLCRCGHSADKPRCDGTHKKIGFVAPGVPPTSRTS